MGSIGRYMFRTTMGAFVITLVSLTVVIWFTQAIREFDLITSQRQTLFVFVGITGLFIPLLVMMIAPISLVLAAAHVLNKLSSDSEIIVMNAAGVSPWRLLRPFLAGGVCGFAPGRRHRRLCFAAEPACVARLGARRCAPTFSPISCSPAASPRSAAISPSTSPTGGRTDFWSAYSSTIAAIRTNTPPISPSRARS